VDLLYADGNGVITNLIVVWTDAIGIGIRDDKKIDILVGRIQIKCGQTKESFDRSKLELQKIRYRVLRSASDTDVILK
jgi:hypothetical protein